MAQRFATANAATLGNTALDPTANRFSDEFIHMGLGEWHAAQALIEMIVCEYAGVKPDAQAMLKPLVLSFLAQVARLWRQMRPTAPAHDKPTDLMRQYIDEHFHSVTLGTRRVVTACRRSQQS